MTSLSIAIRQPFRASLEVRGCAFPAIGGMPMVEVRLNTIQNLVH